MTSLVTLQEIKTQLRITHPWEDDALTAFGDYASALVFGELKVEVADWDPLSVKGLAIKAATLQTVELLYVRRGGEAEVGANPEARQPDGRLPVQIANLLHKYRAPAFA